MNRTWRLAFTVSTLLTSCRPEPIYCGLDDLPEGQEYEAVVVAPFSDEQLKDERTWNLSTLPSCGLTDVHLGDRYRVRAQGASFVGPSCNTFVCPDDLPTPGERTKTDTVAFLGARLCLNDRTKVKLSPNCEVGRYVSIQNPDPQRDPFTPFARTGGFPVALIRILSTFGGNLTCDTPPVEFPDAIQPSTPQTVDSRKRFGICADAWALELKRL